jgi:hypothetical protein
MSSVPSLLIMMEEPVAPAIVVMPWDYVSMRRQAAGLTIAQAARPYWHRAEHRADVERNLATLESVGFRLQRGFYVVDLSRSFPVSVDVYRHLCVTSPDRHPRLCLACGWDEWTPQFDRDGQDVTWSTADPQLCTGCELERRPIFVGRPAEIITSPRSAARKEDL